MNIRISSSGIRHMIEEGRITAANKALGLSLFYKRNGGAGKKLGRTLGFPTANVKPAEPYKLASAQWSLCSTGKCGRPKDYQGMLNIGIRPTIESEKHERTIEVNLFDFNADIYDKPIQITFHEWLRSEMKFNSLQELQDQIAVDKVEVLKLFKTISGNK